MAKIERILIRNLAQRNSIRLQNEATLFDFNSQYRYKYKLSRLLYDSQYFQYICPMNVTRHERRAANFNCSKFTVFRTMVRGTTYENVRNRYKIVYKRSNAILPTVSSSLRLLVIIQLWNHLFERHWLPSKYIFKNRWTCANGGRSSSELR